MAVNSALAGEREQMKRLGIVIRETDVLQLALAQSGKTVASTLTSQEKATATLALITEKAGVAVGDLDRTQNSSANVARKLIAMFKELRDTMAKILMPVFGEVLTSLSGQSGKFDEIKNKLLVNANIIQSWGRLAISAFSNVAKIIFAPVRSIGNLIQAMGNLIVATKAFIDRNQELRKEAMEDFDKNFNQALEAAVSPIQAIADLTADLWQAIETSGTRGKGLTETMNELGTTINTTTRPAVTTLSEQLEKMNNDIGTTVEMLGDKLGKLTEDFATGMVGNVVSSLSTMSNAFTGFFTKMQKQLVEATMQWLVFKALTGLFPESEFVANLTGTQVRPTSVKDQLAKGKRGSHRMIAPQAQGLPASAVVNQNINFSVNAIDSQDAARFINDNQGEIAKVVVDASRKSFGVRKAFTTGSP